VVRDHLKRIPNLAELNYDEATPLSPNDSDSFFEDAGFSRLGDASRRVGGFCLRAIQGHFSLSMVEGVLATVA
jgi:hypothetical protein